MKTSTNLSLSVFVLFLTIQVHAQNKIAVQNGGTPKFYTVLIDAVNNAVSGDTIYMPGGIFSADFTVSKKLHFVGVGHYIDSTKVTGITRLLGSISLGTNSDKGSIEGVYIDGDVNFGTTGNPIVIKEFSIRRCNVNKIYFNTDGIDTQIRYSNILIIENIIRDVISSTSITYNYNYPSYTQVQSNIISNNFINRGIMGLGYNCVIKNNIIFIPNMFSNYYIYVKGCTLDNNILFFSNSGGFSYTSAISYSTLRNNLFVIVQISAFASSNIYLSNLYTTSTSSIFVSFSGTASSQYSTLWDLHLQASSPGKNAGTDGTDIGIYGGAYPWKAGSVPSYPHFQAATIAPQTDNTGKLNVKIKVAAQDN